EPLDQTDVRGEFRAQNLDRRFAPHERVLREVNGAHSPFAEERQHPVVVYDLAYHRTPPGGREPPRGSNPGWLDPSSERSVPNTRIERPAARMFLRKQGGYSGERATTEP